jgi:imidazolonepropionase
MTAQTRAADLLLTGCRLATLVGPEPYGLIQDGAIAVSDGRITWTGRAADAPDAREVRRLDGRLVTPGLIDPHTHLVFGGDRVDEFAARSAGATYAEISAAGGGILSTVRATRAADQAELTRTALARLRDLAADGVTTVEIKSGYGLDLETERRTLRAARAAGRLAGVEVVTTYLGLHAVPPEHRADRAAYVAQVRDETLPTLAAEGLIDAVDAFAETIAFTPEEVASVFERARALGLPVKLHADQLGDGGGAALAGRYGALSADHIEYASEAGIAAMAEAGVVAVLLPGAFYTLRETRRPPMDRLRAAGVALALATDLNPGTSPIASLLTVMNMAVVLFGFTAEEALAGVTRHAARALGLHGDRGVLSPGLRADLVVWNVEHPAELSYWLGRRLCDSRYVAGVMSAAGAD